MEGKEGRIVILVTEGLTGQVIENARIIVEPGGTTSTTNINGTAEIRIPSSGIYTLFISVPGYNRMQALKIRAGDSLSMGVSTSFRSRSESDGGDVEAPNDGTYLMVMDTLPSIKGGMNELARIVVYPEMAQRMNMEGTVYVRIYISETGSVVKAIVEKSATPILDRAALDAIMKISFEPAKHNGKNIKSVVTLPIRFRSGN